MDFAFIKVLEFANNNTKLDSFIEAMNENYHLDDDIDAEDLMNGDSLPNRDYRDLVEWVIKPASELDNLPVGTMFKGCTMEGLMYSYQVISRTEDGKTIWFPLSSDAELVGKLHHVDVNTAEWEVIAFDDLESLTAWMMVNCINGHFYKVTDFADKPFDIFTDGEAEDDDDEDTDDQITESKTIRMCYWPKTVSEPNFISVDTIQNFMEVNATYNEMVKLISKNSNK